jgi:hypothetical protein
MPAKGWRKFGGDLPRLMSKLKPEPSGCLIYQGAVRQDTGYGAIQMRERGSRDAHLVMWELVKGAVPEGMHLDHTCKNRLCCNVEHLEPVTPRVNGYVRNEEHVGKVLARRTHCKHGHEFTPENTMHFEGSRGRKCRECSRLACSAAYHRKNPDSHTLGGTHCRRGHEFTPENTYIYPATGTRACRECRRIKKSEWEAAQKVMNGQ